MLMKNNKNKTPYFYKSIQILICFCFIFVSFKTWATPKFCRDSVAVDSIISDNFAKKYKIELITPESSRKAFLAPSFSLGSSYCSNNGTPCDPADDLVCVPITINETGDFKIGFKQCIAPEGYLGLSTVTVSSAGQTFTVCLSRSAAIAAGCTGGAQILVWIGRVASPYDASDVFSSIPASCSGGSGASAPSVSNNSGCVGSNVTLSASCSSGTPQWYTSSSGGSAFYSGSSYSTTYGSSGSFTYYVSCSDGSGCESSRSAVTATINPSPSGSISGTSTICNGQSTTLTASGGVISSWSTGSTRS
jgi:hypothetical protein